MPIYTIELTDDEQRMWEAYVEDHQRQREPGNYVLVPPADIPTVQAMIDDCLSSYRVLVRQWWATHPELHVSESRADA